MMMMMIVDDDDVSNHSTDIVDVDGDEISLDRIDQW